MDGLLLIDTCGDGAGVGLAVSGGLAAEVSLPGRETQEKLMLAIEEVLSIAGIAIDGVATFAAVTGPGSFTGTRIGLAAAMGLAEARQRPLIGLSRLAVLAAQAGPEAGEAWIDAGRGDVFVRRFREHEPPLEMMMRGADAVAAVSGPVVVMEEWLLQLWPAAMLVPPVGVREALPLALAATAYCHFQDTALLTANYLRVPDAELARTRGTAS